MRKMTAYAGLMLMAAGLLSLAAGCATTPPAPAWVSDLNAADQLYPKERFFVGRGVVGGAGPADLMSRKQAENNAIVDVASAVEVKIKDVTETHDTEAMRNGKTAGSQSVRYQNTKRTVTGLVGGTEVREVYFDPRSMNWYALAVLERAKAGRATAEAINQRLERGRAVLQAPAEGPLADYFRLKPLDSLADELDRLIVALNVFNPAYLAETRGPVDTFKHDVTTRLDALKPQLSVAVDLALPDRAGAATAWREELTRTLSARGLTPATGGSRQLEVRVTCNITRQVGAVVIHRAVSGATFTLREGAREIFHAELPADATTEVRAGDAGAAAARSLERLRGNLAQALAEELDKRLQGTE